MEPDENEALLAARNKRPDEQRGDEENPIPFSLSLSSAALVLSAGDLFLRRPSSADHRLSAGADESTSRGQL